MIISLVELSMMLDAVAKAVVPLVSIYYHEENYPAVNKVIRSAVKLSLIKGAIFSLIFFLFANHAPVIFGD